MPSCAHHYTKVCALGIPFDIKLNGCAGPLATTDNSSLLPSGGSLRVPLLRYARHVVVLEAGPVTTHAQRHLITHHDHEDGAVGVVKVDLRRG